MSDLSDCIRGPIVCARIVGASVTKTTGLFGEARRNASKVMITFDKEEKNLPTEAKLWKKSKVVLLGPSDS